MLIKEIREQLAVIGRENPVLAVTVNLKQFLNLVGYNGNNVTKYNVFINCPIQHKCRNNADLGANCKTRFDKNRPIHGSCQSLN